MPPNNQFDKSLLLSFIEQHFNLTGQILSAEKAYEEFGIPHTHYNSVLNDTACREALIEKGVIFERFEKDDWTSKSLTPTQLAVANTLLDLTDRRSEKKKLQDLEVHTQTYQSWLKDPVFKEYIATRARQMIGDNEHQVDLALLDRIQAGDIKAITYYNEMTGRFVPQRAFTTRTDQVDVQNILVKIIEIITEEVSSKDDAMRISNRLRALVTARNVAGALLSDESEPIQIPEVIKVRELDA